ncbi:MAG: 4-hydroxythreonine-4-phosphate dehydrogenase PdxA [Deltaproteobacteria bacterium]|nr:MAG: 4-hydroxythreonine-4-phosphate dehydrogenase PdxA [Deltaproteobacteria bacterium]
MKAPVLITPGDPLGIGPEVSLKAILSTGSADVVLVGDQQALERSARPLGLPPISPFSSLAEAAASSAPLRLFDPGSQREPVELAALRCAVHACMEGWASGLVTGPIHKARLAARGFAHPGHTEFLGELCGVERPVMAFVGGELRVALVTVHLPLREVASALTRSRVEHTIRVAHRALHTVLGLPRPRLLVCGLNPHAGDQGLLGSEEIEVIHPAIEACVADGIDARGPLSAEGVFRQARSGEADMVIAMYHDQGLAPLKLIDFGRSVNWTLGLPILRVSVDHGTADDIAGQDRADPASMIAALQLARRLVGREG